MDTDVGCTGLSLTHSSPYLKSYGNNEMFGDVRVLKTEATSCELSSQLSMFWMK